ncbi:Uncharacterised protein [Klebsiella pneumoniae]|uniref:Uncharacterized protein n=1 Tax=Klebsiella pneumoniae TaxID=573 RepID=A0A3S4HR17_KLEPN|nr:Uncharacterised protein [Klebsiella pneumoniae]
MPLRNATINPPFSRRGKTADLLRKLQHLVFSAADIVAVNFTFHDISPVEGLFCLAPGRAFRQVSGVVKQRLWFSHRCHPYKKASGRWLIVYIFFALLPIIVRLTQQRAALALETLGVIAKPVFDFTEAVDKRLLIALLQQADRFAETLVVALNQRQVVFR